MSVDGNIVYLQDEFCDDDPAEKADDLVAFYSSEGVLLSDSEKDQMLVAMSVYLANELRTLDEMIREMQAYRKRLVRFMNGLAT